MESVINLPKLCLAYELAIRNLDIPKLVEDMRKSLIDNWNSDIREYSAMPFDEEYKEILNILTILNFKIESASLNKTAKNILICKSIFNHIGSRFERINVDDLSSDEFPKLNDICKEFNNVRNKMSLILSEENSTNVEKDPVTVHPLNQVVVTKSFNHFAEVKKYKFSGNSCPITFIENIEFFAKTRELELDKIVPILLDCFSGNTVDWFKLNIDKFNNWQNFKNLLLKDFEIYDSDYMLRKEIEACKQKLDEKIVLFVSKILSMCKKLKSPFSDIEIVSVLRRNMLPKYSSMLKENDVISIDSLTSACRWFENCIQMSSSTVLNNDVCIGNDISAVKDVKIDKKTDVAKINAKLAPRFVKCKIIKKISPLVYELCDDKGANIGK